MEFSNTASELPLLISQEGPLEGLRWSIGQPLLLGRDSSCDIVIPERQVSRYHARLSPIAEGILLEDLGSKNGTFCNGKKVEGTILLQDGDVLQIALVQTFTFVSSDSTLPLEAVAKTPEIINSQVQGKLRLDQRSRRVFINEKEISPPLSAPQFKLLQTLYEYQGKVVSREDLIVAVWGEQESFGVSEQALDALVRRLRDRIRECDPNHVYVVTIRGHGLRLDNPGADGV